MLFKGVPIFNKRWRNFVNGGYVKPHKNMNLKQLNNDSVKAILMPNELVLPVKYKGFPLAQEVLKLLKQNRINLPNT